MMKDVRNKPRKKPIFIFEVATIRQHHLKYQIPTAWEFKPD